jgi:hypothetical protein
MESLLFPSLRKKKATMRFLIFLLLPFVFVCQPPTESEDTVPNSSPPAPLPLVSKEPPSPSLNYDSLKQVIRLRRAEFARAYENARNDSARRSVLTQAGQYLFSQLTGQLFPAWYGTPWAYEGISQVPGKGEIACGYFVSTTLKHADFKLNRYRLAQAYSLRIVLRYLCWRICWEMKN